MKEVLIKKYEASDGTQFDKQDDCLKYELIESAKVIVKHCIGMANCTNCVLRAEDSCECILQDIPQYWDLSAYCSAKDLEK